MRAVVIAFFLIACGEAVPPADETTNTVSESAAEVTTAAQEQTGMQEHTIEVAGTFTPSSINVDPGEPVRLHFRRGAEASCADEIVFPDLGIRKKIAANETVTIDLPAQESGTLRFACGMDMMKGSLVVQSAG